MIQLRWLVKEVSTRKELRPGSYGGAMIDGTKIVNDVTPGKVYPRITNE